MRRKKKKTKQGTKKELTTTPKGKEGKRRSCQARVGKERLCMKAEGLELYGAAVPRGG